MTKRRRKTKPKRRTSFLRSMIVRRVLAYFGISSPAVLLLVLLNLFGVPVPLTTEEAAAQAKAKIAQKVNSLLEQSPEPTRVAEERHHSKDHGKETISESAPSRPLPVDPKNPADVVRTIGWLLDPKSSHHPRMPAGAVEEPKPSVVHTPKEPTNASRDRGGWGEEDPHPWRFRR